MPSVELQKFEDVYEVFVEQTGGDFTVTTFETKHEALLFIAKLRLRSNGRDYMNLPGVNIDVGSSDVEQFLHSR
jgi:hypothetical protein